VTRRQLGPHADQLSTTPEIRDAAVRVLSTPNRDRELRKNLQRVADGAIGAN
jgi:hypothetical protein